MDEFAAYHALGCATHPVSAELHVFREGCGQYGLALPGLGWRLPLRSYLYIGSLPVVPFYPFWRVFGDPVAARVQGALFLAVATLLAARLARASTARTALAALLLPVLVGAFVVDTGPVGLSLVLLMAALLLVRRAARAARRREAAGAAAAAGVVLFLGLWVKLVFAWVLPAAALFALTEAWAVAGAGRGRNTGTGNNDGPGRRPLVAAALAGAVGLGLPTALLLGSTTADGTPYFEVARVGRFSAEPEAMATVGLRLLSFVWNGSSLFPRAVTWPASPLDHLPALAAAAVLAAGLASRARRDVARFLLLALATALVTVVSGRALAHHHLALALAFVWLALAAALAARPRRALAALAMVIAVHLASLVWRAPAVRVDPYTGAGKDRLLEWLRADGRDARVIQLHASWGTYYIAHLFGSPEAAVLFSRKFARDPAYLGHALGLAERHGRELMLVSNEPDRLDRALVASLLGPPIEHRRFGEWEVFVFSPPAPPSPATER